MATHGMYDTDYKIENDGKGGSKVTKTEKKLESKPKESIKELHKRHEKELKELHDRHEEEHKGLLETAAVSVEKGAK